MSQPFTPTLFDIEDPENWMENLDREGCVVIKNVLSSEEREHGLTLFKKDMATVSPDLISMTLTWSIETCPLMFGKGMAVFNGFGQSDFMWHLRTNPKIQSELKQIYSTDELVTGWLGFRCLYQKLKSLNHAAY